MDRINEFVSTLLEQSLFTQEQLSSYLGVDQSLISKWKSKERKVTSEQFEKLCLLFGYSASDVVEGVNVEQKIINLRAANITSEDMDKVAMINRIVNNLAEMEAIDKYAK